LKASYIKFSEKLIKDAKDKFTAQLEKEKNKPLVAHNVAELSINYLNIKQSLINFRGHDIEF